MLTTGIRTIPVNDRNSNRANIDHGSYARVSFVLGRVEDGLCRGTSTDLTRMPKDDPVVIISHYDERPIGLVKCAIALISWQPSWAASVVTAMVVYNCDFFCVCPWIAVPRTNGFQVFRMMFSDPSRSQLHVGLVGWLITSLSGHP